MMFFRSFAFAAALFGALALTGAVAHAATYGLAVGIDEYPDGDLAGAVADAEAIADALQNAGAAQVELLTNHEADSQAVEAAWQKLLAEARYGDTIVFTFAGKGDLYAGELGESGPRFRLGDLDALPRQVVLDWARTAEEKGVKLIFVGDASFSGGLERTYPADLVQLRQSGEGQAEPPAPGSRPENNFSRAVFAYGAPDGKGVPELRIGDAPRGGLSWAFVQALTGAAEEDSDGLLSDHELSVYLPLAVGAMTEGQQEVQVLPRRSSPVTFFPAPQSGNKSEVAVPKLRLAVVDGEAAVVGDFPDVEIVDDPADAELIWSVADETLTHRIGGVVASGIDSEKLGNALEKWSALNWLVARSAHAPVPIDLVSGAGRLPEGERAQIEILPGRSPMLTLFDLGPAGDIQPILPENAEAAQKPETRRHIHQMFQVAPGPDGAQHRIVIFSDKPLTGLHAALKEMAESGSSDGLLAALQEALPPDAKAQIGILPIYTGPSGAPAGE